MENAGDVLRKFYAAAVVRDLATARSCLSDDMVFEGLFETYRSAEQYMKTFAGLLQITVRLEVKKIISESNDAAVFFELQTNAPAETTVLVAEWHQVRDGRIFHARSAFDGRPYAAMFAGAVTHAIENMGASESGWLAAIRDPQIGRALALLHSQSRRQWTIISLAHEVAMSRSTFAARFKQLTGEPPQHYFTRVRISAAAYRLRTSTDKLKAIASAAGYESLPAFVKSFKRHTGMTPGEYRMLGGKFPSGGGIVKPEPIL